MTVHPTARRRVGLAIALVAAGLIGGLGATAANASFTDVRPEGAFTEHITNVQEAGIATGFNDGSFRPRAEINRGQAAAWLDRSASRFSISDLPGDDAPTVDPQNPTATVSTVEMTSPASGDGQGWVSLQGGVGAIPVDGADNCPCTILLYLRNSDGDILGRSALTVSDPQGSLAISTGYAFAVAPLAAGDTETYFLDAELIDGDVTLALAGAFYGTYAPIADNGSEADAAPGGAGTAEVTGDPVESVVPELPIAGN